MKNTLKGIFAGIVIGVIVAGAVAYAVSGTVQKTLHYKDIQIFLDGKKVKTQDINGNTVEPFIIDGTTYLPVRAISEAFGKEVTWDGNTNIIYIGEKPTNNYMDAFAENIKEVINQYGMYYNKNGGEIGGLKYGRLIDFEDDSVPELVLVHDSTVLVYRFDGEKSHKVYEKKLGGKLGNTGADTKMGINETLKNPCLLVYDSTDGWDETIYAFAIVNGQAEIRTLCADAVDVYMDFPDISYLNRFKIDGKDVSKEEYMALRDTIYTGEKEIYISSELSPEFWPLEYITKEGLTAFLNQFNIN